MKATTTGFRIVLGVMMGLALTRVPCSAQSDVGTVASVVGALEVQRGRDRTWQPLLIGGSVLRSDRIRTGSDAAAKIILHDDSVLDFGAETQLTVERFAPDADAQRQRSLLKLAQGTLRVLQVDSAGGARGRYEIETPTAVINARAPAFVVQYDVRGEHTDVVGVEGLVEVQGTIGVIEQGVQVGPRQFTRVLKGRLPSPPEDLTPERFAAYQQSLVIVGTGSRETLDADHPLVAARLLRPDDRPGTTGRAGPIEGSYLRPKGPGETLAEQYSRDLGARTQPIPEFRYQNPGEVPPN